MRYHVLALLIAAASATVFGQSSSRKMPTQKELEAMRAKM